MLLNIQVVERYAHKAWPAPLFIQTWAQHPISHLIMFAPFSNICTPQYCTITSLVEDTSLSNVPSSKEALFKPIVDTTLQDIQTKLRCLSSFNILKCSNLYPYLLCKHILFFMRTLILRHFVLNRGNSASFEIGIPLIPAPALCPNSGFVVWKKMCNLSNLSSCKQCEVVFY